MRHSHCMLMSKWKCNKLPMFFKSKFCFCNAVLFHTQMITKVLCCSISPATKRGRCLSPSGHGVPAPPILLCEWVDRAVSLISLPWQAQHPPATWDTTPIIPDSTQLPLLLTQACPLAGMRVLAFLFKHDKYLICERVAEDHTSTHKGPSAEYATLW